MRPTNAGSEFSGLNWTLSCCQFPVNCILTVVAAGPEVETLEAKLWSLLIACKVKCPWPGT